jgi:hypothetical protein
MQSCFVRLAGMADMLRTSSSGSMARLAQSHEEPARLQIVTIVVLMNFEQPAFRAIYSTTRLLLPLPQWYQRFPTMIAGDAHINRHYL